MTTTAAAPPKPPLTPAQVAEKAFRDRMPKVRHTLTIILPEPTGKYAKVHVTEQGESVLLRVVEAGSSICHPVRLNLTEARKLAEHLNTTCTRIVKRPSYRP